MGRKPGTPKTGGRKMGSLNKTTAEVKAIAQLHGPDAIAKLVELMQGAESDQVKVAACKEILDRAYGKAPQAITGEGGGPVEIKAMFAEISSMTGLLPSDDLHNSVTEGQLS